MVNYFPLHILVKGCCRLLIDLKTNQILLQGRCQRGLYPISTESAISSNPHAFAATTSSHQLWHRRLGHPSYQVLLKLPPPANSGLQSASKTFNCTACELSKSHKLPFTTSSTRSLAVLDLVHSDVWGPSPILSLFGYKYYVLFIDDFSRFTWLYPLKLKSDVPSVFSHFKAQVERQFNKQIKCFRTDGGGEYLSTAFQNFLAHCGIIHQVTCPYTPEQNGVAERKHRHIVEVTRTLLHDASLPQKFWVHAVQTAVFLINRLPSLSKKTSSPYQLLFHHPPDYTILRTFGCLCYPFLPQKALGKFHSKSLPCIFLGYPAHTKGYLCYHIDSKNIFISRHVKFYECHFPFSTIQTSESTTESIPLIPTSSMLVPTNIQNATDNPPSTIFPTSETISITQPTLPVDHISSTSPARTSSPLNASPSRISPSTSPSIPLTSDISSPVVSQAPPPTTSIHPMLTRFRSGNLKPKHIISMQTDTIPIDPTSYSEAVKHPAWRQAMSDEFTALQHQSTWTLVPNDSSRNVLGCKWIYRTKFNPDGSVARYKARLVALGCRQQFGLDYFHTFSPVAKLPTIRIFLTVAVSFHWQILQLDVSNAFLHGALNETVYMSQPPGFKDTVHPDYVCLLHKFLYGLKQSPRQWFDTFSNYLLQFGFHHSTVDPSLLIYTKQSVLIYILVYVDDILLTGNDNATITCLLTALSSKFQMKNLGRISHFLGMHVSHTSQGLHLSQAAYATQILQRAGMSACKPISSPIPTKLVTETATSSLALSTAVSDLFRHLIGSLQYLTVTRPDITFTVNRLCQHMHCPQQSDFKLLKRLLRYLKGTLSFGIPITATDLQLHAYSDSDWAGDPADRKSTTGYCAFLGSNLISWQVKKNKRRSLALPPKPNIVPLPRLLLI
ncbi:hypothetical protein KFK09_025013 [Dendrobium nobile]|uniref:Integrase catalytic domain-containing protein n=1 Tax=Dendrobium nobile TaxID=94219 RepID=A0A8T3AET6_DENNO|nr:hypothetical protein KFK09_025013 [Dendrobium nobile]